MRSKAFVFHQRIAQPGVPAGWTVTKGGNLPDGDFKITEYSWGDQKLWFLDSDNFTADDRQEALLAFYGGRHLDLETEPL